MLVWRRKERTMMHTDIHALNEQYAIPGHVRVEEGNGGLLLVEVANPHARATIALHGGHVVAFQPHGAEPVLFLSRKAVFADGKGIRGGIPVCWPWFGPHPSDPSRPQHGFVRTTTWQLRGTTAHDDGTTEVRLGLRDTDRTRQLWHHAFDLELQVMVGQQLHVALTATNTGTHTFTCGGALHSYFQIGDIADVAVHGLDGVAYIDKVDGGAEKRQSGNVTVAQEVDRIYLDTTGRVVIDDPVMDRAITIDKLGSATTVIWNPWEEKAARIADFDLPEFRQMLCVETSNADDDIVHLAPGQQHTLTAILGVGPR